MADPITLAAIAAVGAGAVNAAGTIAQGNAAVAAANANRANLGAQAADTVAAATRAAEEKDHEAKLLMSTTQANAAASGGSATDAGVLDILGGIAQKGNVQSRELVRQGQEQGNQLRYQGKLGVWNAKNNQRLGYLAAGGQLLSGVSDAYTKYGSGTPAATSGTSWYT